MNRTYRRHKRTILNRALIRAGHRWVLPVGSDRWSPDFFYCATYHDPDGSRGLNPGYKGQLPEEDGMHTGVDLNLDWPPWGDIDRGQPVRAITKGKVEAVGYFPPRWLGVVQVKYWHRKAREWTWWRYAHLDRHLHVEPGQWVKPDQELGVLGDFPDGGDHLHLDAAWDPFALTAWLDRSVRWLDPVAVLEMYMPVWWVHLMLGRGDAGG